MSKTGPKVELKFKCDPYATSLINDVIATEHFALGYMDGEKDPIVIHIEDQEAMGTIAVDDVLLRIDGRGCHRMKAVDIAQLLTYSSKGYRALEFKVNKVEEKKEESDKKERSSTARSEKRENEKRSSKKRSATPRRSRRRSGKRSAPRENRERSTRRRSRSRGGRRSRSRGDRRRSRSRRR